MEIGLPAVDRSHHAPKKLNFYFSNNPAACDAPWIWNGLEFVFH